MKKRISLILTTILCVFLFVSCGSSEENRQEITMEYEIANVMATSLGSFPPEAFEEFYQSSDTQLEAMLLQAGIVMTGEEFRNLLSAWETGIEECGLLLSLGEFKPEYSGSQLSLVTEGMFEHRAAEIKFNFDESGNIETLTVAPEYSMSEILSKAGLNTLLGMGTVFSVLIFIAFVISLFRFIPQIEAKFNKKTKQPVIKEIILDEVKEETEVDEIEVNQDNELVAVIMAAIAASEEAPIEGFVVRSIKRKKSNVW